VDGHSELDTTPEHLEAIIYNKSNSIHSLHFLENEHVFGPIQGTMDILKTLI
jgi:hypothetical protein